ncbi:MAG TPA: LuxR C-terminal-related transcriptional regulator [Solirubrobacteraceae bacterium]|nr:LuxR C-terminal-related transcriptional regulator [Solirubrobacteraceae bacterium]
MTPITAPHGSVARRRTRDARPFADGYVGRADLMARLLEGRSAKLVLIVAPAGYGKSTLLAEWAHCDPRRFVAIAPAGGEGVDGVVQRALQDAADLPSVFLIDDAQSVPARALRQVATALLAQLRSGSQVALASRTQPSLPVGRLRAQRELLEIRTEDLAMSPAEAANLLRLAGLELDFASVQALSRETEGWPAGLYLAALSLRAQDDVRGGLKRFAGDDHFVAEYFRDEVLAPLSRKRARFLTRASVLDELSGSLCDAVLEQTATAGELAELARSNQMLIPIDPMDERFRWHGLFRAMLRSELRRTEPELEPRLHTRASDWLERHGNVDGAIGHAIAAGDASRAGDLLWGNILGYVAGGRNEVVQEWLGSLRPDQITASAALALAAAHSCLVNGAIDHARHYRLAAGAARRAAGTSPEPGSLAAGEAVFDALAVGWDVGQMARAGDSAYELEPEDSPWRPYCRLVAGVAGHLAGDRALAASKLEEGAAIASATVPGIASLCLAQLALLSIEQDDWDTAAEVADRALVVAGSPGLVASPISALVFAAAAATEAHRGHVDAAKRDLRHGTELLAALGDFIPWYGAETRIMLARAAVGLADTVRARTLLAEASRLARRTCGAVIFQHCFEQAWAQIDTLAEATLAGPSSLTIAELRILRFLPSHRSFREIAERLDVSVNTVKTQAHAIYRKLDAASRSEAVARASRAGLLGD